MCTRCLVVLTVLASLLISSASAEIPQLISYQGKVTDSGGTPIADGDYSMTFTLYDAATGGSPLWSSGAVTVTVRGGVFSVLLGESPQPALPLAFDVDYWVETSIEGDLQSPRTRLASVGYAYMASGIVPGTEVTWTASYPAIKGTNYGAGAGLRGDSDQGIGVRGETSATDGKGVYGVANAATGINYGVYGTSGSTYGSGVYGTATATTGSTYGGRFENSSTTFGRGGFAWAKGTAGETAGVYGVNSSPSGYAIRGEADATTGTNYGVYGKTNSTDGYGGYFDGRGYFSGNVGIGTTTPGAKLDVRGSAVFNEYGHDVDFRVEGDTGENLLFVDASTDRVGIGTAAPNATLDARGSVIFNDDGGDNDFRVEGQWGPNLLFCDASTNWVGVGTDTPAYALDVRGDIRAKVPGSNPCVYTSVGSSGAGIYTIGSNGSFDCKITNDGGYTNRGSIRVCDAGGNDQAGIYVDSSGDGVVWGDTKSFRMVNPNQSDTEIWYACIEGPEAAAYVRGTARLENGRASISFPDHFQAVATAEGMTVQLTPWSADSEGLAVTRRSIEGIEVRELRDGTGSYSFDYTVMAIRKGYEDYRVIRPADEMHMEPLPAAG